MQIVNALPKAFESFKKMGGCLDFTFFDEVENDLESQMSGISRALSSRSDFDRTKLESINHRYINENQLLGDWYDRRSGDLLSLGGFNMENGEVLRNPRLKDLNHADVRSSVSESPDVGSGGQLAYAFSQPPYRLQASSLQIQVVFDQIKDFILPAMERCEIIDWSDPKLPEVSSYFKDGSEWWGVFLFTVYIPANRKLSVILGSSTD